MGFAMERLDHNFVAFNLPAGRWNGMDMLACRDFLGWVFEQHKEAMVERATWKLCDADRALVVLLNALMSTQELRCVFWDWDLLKGAIAGSEAFVGQSFAESDVPAEPMLWLFGDSLSLTAKSLEALEITGDARFIGQMLWRSRGVKGLRGNSPEYTGRVGLTICDIYLPYASPEQFAADDMAYVPILRAWPPIYGGDSILGAPYSEVLAAQRFMAQPFVSVERPDMPRQFRRQYERKHGQEPPVRTVVLRKAGQDQGRRGGEPRSEAEWSCRWLVRGHWRKRAKRQGEGDPVYVRPHLKGPEDRPFKAPRATAFAVRR